MVLAFLFAMFVVMFSNALVESGEAIRCVGNQVVAVKTLRIGVADAGDDLRRTFGAPGDTAQAYVIAHEVGHHVQNQLGISDRVQSERQRMSERAANELSVRLELQADYLAGVWAHHAEKSDPDLFEPGDIEEALRAAAAIGDDRLQEKSQGYVVPDAFTHGSSKQRAHWFRRGYETGDVNRMDHFFEADEL